MITIKFFKFSDCRALSLLRLLPAAGNTATANLIRYFFTYNPLVIFFYIALSLTTFPFNHDKILGK